MQTWEYTFPPSSKEDWIRQIEKDLKGKPIDSLYREWWTGEPLIPFHHASDAPPEPIVLPDELFASPPRIVESFDISNKSGEQINKLLLEALQFGTQTFLIKKDNGTNLDINQILEGVFPDMIHWHLYTNKYSLSLFHEIAKRTPQTTFLRFNRSESRSGIKSLLEEFQQDQEQLQQIKLEYHFTSRGNWVESAGKIFQQLIEDWNQWKTLNTTISFFDKCILTLDADIQYFKQIIQTRVLHLLWLNLLDTNSVLINDHPEYLECHIHPKVNQAPEHYLIRASMSSLAAVLTGTTSLCIHHLKTEGISDFYKRIDRNIHHLLHLESGLPPGKDPLAGAYTLDYYTRLWTERIWNQIL